MKPGKNKSALSAYIGVSVGRTVFCVAVFFVFMLLLNGKAMYKSAECLEYGRVRDFWLAVLKPLQRSSEFTGLFYLRELTETTLGSWLNKTSEKGN